MEPNPCALLLAAFRRAAATRGQAELRFQARVELMRLALRRGHNEEEVGNLLRLLEWIMQLPEVLEKRYEELLEEVKSEAARAGSLEAFEQRLQAIVASQSTSDGLMTPPDE